MRRGDRVTIGYAHGTVIGEYEGGHFLVEWDSLRRGLVHGSWLRRE